MGPLREVQLTLTPSNRLRARACQAAAWRPAEAGDGSTGDAPPAGCDHGHRAAGPVARPSALAALLSPPLTAR